MHLSSVAPGQPTTTTPAGRVAAAPPADNPWGFPPLDRRVAQQALDGLRAGTRAVDRLIDRSIAVRVQLDRDLRAGTFGQDTVRAVELLTRARDYALGTLHDRHLSRSVQEPIVRWIRANADDRIRVVAREMARLERSVSELLDDDEGNVREELAQMRETPGRHAWQAVRDTLDGSIALLYQARDTSASRHVLRAAGGLR